MMMNIAQLFVFLLICFLVNIKGFGFVEATRCRFRGNRYTLGQTWSFEAGAKIFRCTCASSGFPDCTWKAKEPVAQSRCYDRRTRSYRLEGARWERIRGRRTFDCICERNERRRMQIACSGENRCHQNGTSYKRGDDWQSSDITGLVMDCQCHGRERITCKASVTTEVPTPAVDVQWIEDHIVYGRQVLRPRITNLQACDTGHRVVSSGYTWNETDDVGATEYTVQRCECRDALIQCEPYRVSRRSEPHCLTVDGAMKNVGDEWTRVHQAHSNIRWRCHCRAHGDPVCRDIGFCPDPTPPPNGAMVCVAAGDAGPQQSTYCKPICARGFDFLNRQRYYRIWEVCSAVTHHRWSGGYLEDALLLGKCRRPTSNTRGRPSLYLPTDDCESLTSTQIRNIKLNFVRSLHNNHLCGNKCQVKWFRCGRKE